MEPLRSLLIRRGWCNCHTPLCWLDNALHDLGIDSKRICDAHDAQIMKSVE